eukprot:13525061-Alexandrium_andersonii.AAC.1
MWAYCCHMSCSTFSTSITAPSSTELSGYLTTARGTGHMLRESLGLLRTLRIWTCSHAET